MCVCVCVCLYVCVLVCISVYVRTNSILYLQGFARDLFSMPPLITILQIFKTLDFQQRNRVEYQHLIKKETCHHCFTTKTLIYVGIIISLPTNSFISIATTFLILLSLLTYCPFTVNCQNHHQISKEIHICLNFSWYTDISTTQKPDALSISLIYCQTYNRLMNICCISLQYSPSGLYCATMVTVCPAFFSAAAACSCVALDRSTPFTYTPTRTESISAHAGSIAINV